jgi:DNA-directed RNA polymerase specialized sigma subunit
MKNYQNSDYAVNKKAKGIVYRFADQTIEVGLEDYLRENPNKTEADFAKLKALSDSDYYEQDRDDYRQTWKDVPLSGLDETELCSTPSAEIEIIGRDEQAAKQRKRQELALAAIGKLTDVQRRRYLMYHSQGMTVREIAAEEGVAFQVVGRSILGATKKIKKFLASTQKMG